jgi:hypothetical protein
VRLVLLGDRREAYDLPIFLGQQVADQVIPRVKPEGRLSGQARGQALVQPAHQKRAPRAQLAEGALLQC